MQGTLRLVSRRKVYGPYRGKDGRWRVVVDSKTLSYPRYLIQQSIGRLLHAEEDVHHLDHNPDNNELTNLEIIKVGKHRRQHAVKYIANTEVKCFYCGKLFNLSPLQQRRRQSNSYRRNKGPFCSKHCVGLYGQEQQARKRLIESSQSR